MPVATIGLDCYTYRNSNTVGSPTWALLDTVQDVSSSISRTAAEASSRASKFKKYLGGLIDIAFTLKFLRKKGDTQQAALKAAFVAQPPTVIQYAFADGPIATTGTIYTKAEMIVTEFSDINEGLESAADISVKLQPAAQGTTDPSEVTV